MKENTCLLNTFDMAGLFQKNFNVSFLSSNYQNNPHTWNLRSTREETAQDHIGGCWNIHNSDL